ncbi:polysaccharide biosynthesis protein [Nitratidesulfovibrio vulgaris]|uniref:polysaccharide biosynthesis protein n=1 Tax=Nitratidesulfovibrio vulgaris TaxID=881 RepID=UPI0023014943|nr:polysaccharide biosynthesis protein [Nitratidesulfovibrio vulgaris]WCB46373.1 polysaccharide biosynthesis protein [Nitratidesulfovibrio vulgaris]
MYFKDKTVLVTGGTGSMGGQLVRRILTGEKGMPRKVIVFSRDEAKQHDMRVALSKQKKTVTDEKIYSNFLQRLEFRIGDVRRYADVCSAVRDADIVINAAALKQVPTCEYFPDQAVQTNCCGVSNIVRAINENRFRVQTVIAISTDKACKPINVMGMTKAIQERIAISANILNPDTRFIAVRYGNVMASRGSVIPLFLEQIARGGPVTVTLPEMTRFLMSIDEAVDTVFAAADGALPGEIYIPIAPSSTVMDLAHALIGDRPVDINVVGIRPGEKIHEVLVSAEEAYNTVRRGDYYVIRPMLPELRRDETPAPPAFSGEYSSHEALVPLPEVAAMLRKHRLIR